MRAATVIVSTHNVIRFQPSKLSTFPSNCTRTDHIHSVAMKCTTFLVAAIALLGVVTSSDQPVVKTSVEALEKVQASALPAGVTLTGTTEKIDPPASAAAVATKEADVQESKHSNMNDSDGKEDDDDKKEFFGGWGGLGGWGNWGGWGGYGPYRFGFMYGGIGGWAYPLGYWNTFGSGLIGGGCGLGIPFGGLYYC